MSLPAQLARIDDLHRRRDDQAAWAEEQQLVQATLARAPNDYGTLWRAARLYFWLSDDPSVTSDQRSKWGQQGWDLAERAIAVNPNDVAGHYWAAVNMGNYALGLGVMKALARGMEGKFKERLKRAGELGPQYEHGSDRRRLGPLLRQAALAQARSEKGAAAPARRAAGAPGQPARARVPGRSR